MRPTDPIVYLALAFLDAASLALCWWSCRLIPRTPGWLDRAGLIVAALMAGGTAWLIWGLL